MKRGIALVLALVFCLTLAACWEAEEQTPDFWEVEPEPVETPEETPSKLSAFTLPYLTGQNFDPITCSDGVQQVVGSLLYEGLFLLDARFAPQPTLCASYTVSANGLTYTFTLRNGVTFSDGSPLTAADVLATYRRASGSERYGARFENVASMRATRGALAITLRQADALFPALLDVPVVKSGTEKDLVPLGTGPYLFLTDSEGPCLTRSENWWRGTALPLERIALVSAKDTDSAIYLFSACDAHLLTADLLTGTPAAALGGVDITDAPASTMLFVGFNAKRPLTGQSAFRRMTDAAIDRDAIVETLLAGHASAARFPIHPASPLYPTELSAAHAGTSYAAALSEYPFAESDPRALTLLANEENPFKVSLAEYLCRRLTEDGLTVTPAVLPWAEYLEALEAGDFDLWLGEVRLTADWDVSPLISANGTLNYGGYSDTATDALLRAFLADGSEASAAALCRQLQAEAPLLPLVFKSSSLLTPEGLIENAAPTAAQPFFNLEDWRFHLPA